MKWLILLGIIITIIVVRKKKVAEQLDKNNDELFDKKYEFYNHLTQMGFMEYKDRYNFSGSYYTNDSNCQELTLDANLKKIAYCSYIHGKTDLKTGIIDCEDIIDVELVETTFSGSTQKIKSLVLNIIGKNEESSFSVYYHFSLAAEFAKDRHDVYYQERYNKAVRALNIIKNFKQDEQILTSQPINHTPSLTKELTELVSLKDKGIISEEEFIKAKQKLIS
ncbi:SHOCT domain-containing protein [Fictibacillus sp. UD]|uniref:SHOCT domain-containing protein n=1 Tax=Fictibacillus sp. UD TaxID=3038777 RepID=UPI0037461F01